MDLLERGETMMRERPPVRAILEDVPQHGAATRDRQQHCPLVDGDAGVVRLHLAHATLGAAIELDDVGHAADSMADQAGEDAPFALGPLPEVGVSRFEKSLGVATPLTRRDRFAEHLHVLTGRHLEPAAPENAIDLLGRHGCPPDCTASTVASSWLPRVRALSISSCSAARAARAPAAAAPDVARVGVLVDAVAAQHEHLAAARASPTDVRRVDRAVADHSRRIVRRSSGRGCFTQMPIRVVGGEELRRGAVAAGPAGTR